MKTVYVGMLTDCIVGLYLTVVCACTFLFDIEGIQWVNYLYWILGGTLVVIFIKNRAAIKRNTDEMVKSLLGKIDTMLLRSWEFYVLAAMLLLAVKPNDAGPAVTLGCLWFFCVSLTRMLLFRHYDKVK